MNTNWGHLSRNIEGHEKTVAHFDSMRQCAELKKRIEKGKTIDSINQSQINHEKERWMAVIKRVIHAILFLAR